MPDRASNPGVEPTGPLVEVDDPTDSRLDDYRHLNDPAGRRQFEADRSIFVVEGKLAVGRLLGSQYKVRSLLIDDHQVHSAAELVAATRATGAPVYVGSRSVVEGTVGFTLHRGVVAVAHRPDPADQVAVLADAAAAQRTDGRPVLLAVLEGLNDHENIGALFRNAAALGVAAVLLDPTCADPLYRRSVRVSMGHVLRVPFARTAPWPDSLEQIKAAGFVVAALAPDLGAAGPGGAPGITLSELGSWLSSWSQSSDGSRPGAAGRLWGVAVLLGGEGPGLSEGALAGADVVVSIPMFDGADSLNVATAAAVAFHTIMNP